MANVINSYRNAGGGALPTEKIISEWLLTSDANDSVGSNNGTATVGVSFDATDGADFTGSAADQIEIADANDLSFGDGTTDVPFSVSMMVKFNAFVGTSNVFHKYKNPFEWIVELGGTGSDLTFLTSSSNAANRIGIRESNWNPSLNTFYHIIITYDGSGSNTGYKIYFDSILSLTSSPQSVGSYTATSNTTSPVFMGRNGNNNNRSLNGWLKNIRIWNAELTQSEIDLVYSIDTA